MFLKQPEIEASLLQPEQGFDEHAKRNELMATMGISAPNLNTTASSSSSSSSPVHISAPSSPLPLNFTSSTLSPPPAPRSQTDRTNTLPIAASSSQLSRMIELLEENLSTNREMHRTMLSLLAATNKQNTFFMHGGKSRQRVANSTEALRLRKAAATITASTVTGEKGNYKDDDSEVIIIPDGHSAKAKADAAEAQMTKLLQERPSKKRKLTDSEEKHNDSPHEYDSEGSVSDSSEDEGEAAAESDSDSASEISEDESSKAYLAKVRQSIKESTAALHARAAERDAEFIATIRASKQMTSLAATAAATSGNKVKRRPGRPKKVPTQ